MRIGNYSQLYHAKVRKNKDHYEVISNRPINIERKPIIVEMNGLHYNLNTVNETIIPEEWLYDTTAEIEICDKTNGVGR